MNKLLNEKSNPKLLSPLTLAFVGDGVYDLLVRQYLVDKGNRPVGELNKEKVQIVNCRSQSEAIKKILPNLTEEETSIFKRGRNASPKTTAKNGTVGDYHNATGLEALFGYIYLKGDTDRLEEIFKMIVENIDNF